MRFSACFDPPNQVPRGRPRGDCPVEEEAWGGGAGVSRATDPKRNSNEDRGGRERNA